MQEYLMAAYQATRHGPIGLDQQTHWRVNFQQICQQAGLKEPPAITFFKPDARLGKPKRTKGRNLLQRLMCHQEAVLAFARTGDPV